jgi:hypothetical protein
VSPPRPAVVYGPTDGCGRTRESDRVAVTHPVTDSDRRSGGWSSCESNLLLGPWPERMAVAQLFNYRSDWPALNDGYRFDEVTTYIDVLYDEQFYYDRFNVIRADRQSVRTGVSVGN